MGLVRQASLRREDDKPVSCTPLLKPACRTHIHTSTECRNRFERSQLTNVLPLLARGCCRDRLQHVAVAHDRVTDVFEPSFFYFFSISCHRPCLSLSRWHLLGVLCFPSRRTDQSDARAADTAKGHFASSDHDGKIRLVLGKAMDGIDQVKTCIVM